MILILSILGIGLLISLFILGIKFKQLKNTLSQNKNKNLEEQLEQYQLELTEKKGLLLREFNAYKTDLENQKEIYTQYITLERKEQTNSLKDLLSAFEAQKRKIDNDIILIEKTLQELQAKRHSINEDLLRQREIESQQDFFTVLLTTTDIEDIKLLRSIEPKLTNKQALNKLIYEVFYKKPLTSMLGRILKGKEVCGIYKITNQLTKEIYIGKSTNIKRRWTEHIKTSLDIGTVAKTKIHSAIKEYGIENFTWEVLEECGRDVYSEKEKFYINFYESDKFGYNMQKG